MASQPRFERRNHAAVVLGVDCITGLQTARILSARGVRVIGVAFDPTHPCARTRACERTVPASGDDEELIDTLARLGRTLEERAVLFPCTDPTVLAVARHRDRLEPWYAIALSSVDTLEALSNKTSFLRAAEAVGLPVPRTLVLRCREDVERIAESSTFPCVLKPASRTARWMRGVGVKVMRIADREELLRAYERCAPFTESLVVQEWIEGSDAELFSCNVYFDRSGEPLVTFVSRKVRQWPPYTGVSSLGVECRNDVVLDFALRLFRSVGFHGLGYVEVKRDRRTGCHFAIEANVGRPTGRSAIAEAGGVELLHTMYCDALDLPLPSDRKQGYGDAKWIYWRQDIRAAFHYWRAGELSLRDWARSCRGGPMATAVFSWTDPLPFVADLTRAASRCLRRADHGMRASWRLSPVSSSESLGSASVPP